MTKREMKRIEEVLKDGNIPRETLHIYLLEKGYTVCDTENLQSLKDAHYEEVGDEGWESEFDL